MKDVVEIFDKNNNKILNDNECQSSLGANDPKFGWAPVMFSLNVLTIEINKLNQRKGFYNVHSLYLKHVKSSFRKLLCKFMNKILSHTYIPPAMLKVRLRPTVKSHSDTKTDSQIYRPVMLSSNFTSSRKES